jgi:hypothetical protein
MGPFKDYHATDFEGLTNSISNRTHDSWSLGRDLNPGPPTNVALLPNRPNSTNNKTVNMSMSYHERGEGENVQQQGAKDEIWV